MLYVHKLQLHNLHAQLSGWVHASVINPCTSSPSQEHGMDIPSRMISTPDDVQLCCNNIIIRACTWYKLFNTTHVEPRVKDTINIVLAPRVSKFHYCIYHITSCITSVRFSDTVIVFGPVSAQQEAARASSIHLTTVVYLWAVGSIWTSLLVKALYSSSNAEKLAGLTMCVWCIRHSACTT